MNKRDEDRRFWSDGHGIHHLATFGERLLVGFVDWAAALFIGGAVGAIVTVTYVYWSAEYVHVYGFTAPVAKLNWYVFGTAETGGILLFEPVAFMFATIVHIAYVIMLARRNDTLGQVAFSLKIKRDNLESLGLRRCLVHKFVGSPGLLLPYILLLLLGILFVVLKGFEAMFYERIDLLGILSTPVNRIWSIGVDAYWIVAPILIVVNHVWVLRDTKYRTLHDVILDTVMVQDRILSTNHAAFPSTGREPVERWD